jgi:hypothetical protein
LVQAATKSFLWAGIFPEGNIERRKRKEGRREDSLDRTTQEVSRILFYHQHSLVQALLVLFPEIGLQISMFPYKTRMLSFLTSLFLATFQYLISYSLNVSEHGPFSLIKYWTGWNVPVERRKFFESYAKQNGFDPLIPENWYNVSKYKLIMNVFTVKSIILQILITNVNREGLQFFNIMATVFQRR